MRLIVLTDIDDTLMQTERKCPAGQDVTVGALSAAGAPGSFMTRKQAQLWSLLEKHADLCIPVTARSQSGLERVQLKFGAGAVVDFGATILNTDGVPDPEWAAEMARESEELDQAGTFQALQDILTTRFDSLSLARVHHSAGIAAYLQLRSTTPAEHAELVDYARQLLTSAPDDYYLHITDRDLCVLPRFVGKGHAVRHLRATQNWDETALVLGLGDSLTDADFMTEADFLVAPGSSRLSKFLLTSVTQRGEHV